MCLLWDKTTWCYSYAKIVTTKSYIQLNSILPFEPHEPDVTLVKYEMCLCLFIFFI